MRMLI